MTARGVAVVELCAALHESGSGRYCCKSLFALVIKNSPGCRRDFRVKMWGTSSPDDKLTGDLGEGPGTGTPGMKKSGPVPKENVAAVTVVAAVSWVA